MEYHHCSGRECRSGSSRSAQALGADPANLDRVLHGGAADARAGQRIGSGLRADQAAAAMSALTDDGSVSVINAPAGSGKTRTLAEAARAWTA